VIDQGLDGDTGAAEAGFAAHALGVDPNDFVDGGDLFGVHASTIARAVHCIA